MMSFFNGEHYPDPTAAEAVDRVMRDRSGSCGEADGEGIRRLADAVVLTAVSDYARLVRCPYRSEALLREKRELEAFFTGRWFRLSSGLDGVEVLRKIRKEVLRRDRA